MAAKDTMRSNKMKIVEALRGDRSLILNKVQEEELITEREYINLKDIPGKTVEGHVLELVDKIMSKGEPTCQDFLKLLQTDEDITSTYPKLRNIQINTRNIPTSVQATSSVNSDVGSEGSQTQKKEPYKLECKPVGLCVIINNKNFMKKKPREGTDKDAESLAEVFSWLGFRVLMCEDQESEKMKATLQYFASPGDLSQLQEFSAKEWSGSEFIDPQKAPEHGDAFICCVLSHGELGEVSGIDDKHLSIKEITRTFKATEDSPLTGKPKVFLIQACQGSGLQQGVTLPDVQCDDSESVTIGELADVLVAIATVEDYKAARHPYHGSWFIQSVCQQLKEGCPSGDDISTIFTRVTDEVSQKDGRTEKGEKIKQVPEIRSTLTKSLVLSPHHK